MVLVCVFSPGLQVTWVLLTLAPCQTWQLRMALVEAQVEVGWEGDTTEFTSTARASPPPSTASRSTHYTWRAAPTPLWCAAWKAIRRATTAWRLNSRPPAPTQPGDCTRRPGGERREERGAAGSRRHALRLYGLHHWGERVVVEEGVGQRFLKSCGAGTRGPQGAWRRGVTRIQGPPPQRQGHSKALWDMVVGVE